MKYTVKYIKTRGEYSSFNVNGYDIRFATKSEKEVLEHLKNMENTLTNNLKFSSFQDLDSDIFRAIEYFAQTNSEMVKSYFLKSKEYVLLELETLKMRRLVTMIGIMKHICGLSITEESTLEMIRTFNNISYNLLATKEILNALFHKRNKATKLTINKSYSTPFGNLTCLGFKDSSRCYDFELNGETQTIFKKSDKDIDKLAEIIINTLSEVHKKVTSKTIDELVDFTDIDDIKIIALYTKAHTELMKKYIEVIIQKFIDDGKQLCNKGFIDGVTTIDILQILSIKKDKEELAKKRTNRNIYFLYNIITKLMNEYIIKQVDLRIENNIFDITQDVWTYYYKLMGKLKYKKFDFSLLKNCSAKREFKLYIKHLLKVESQTKNTLRQNKHLDYKLGWYTQIRGSLDYFITEHSINCFSDITPSMVADYLSDLEFNGLNERVKKNTRNISVCVDSVKLLAKWVRKNADIIRTPKPEKNVFENVVFNGTSLICQEQKDTEIIPEFVLKQITQNLCFLKPKVYKRLLLCSLNTPRRFNELQLLNKGSIYPIIINGHEVNDKFGNPVYQISFVENKKQKNKQIINNGLKYVKKNIPISYIVAREIEEQTKETEILEREINSQRPDSDKINIDKVFVLKNDSMKDGYSLVDNNSFLCAVNAFIKDRNITDEKGNYWNFATKQTRTTGTNMMVQLGHNLDFIQKILGHEHGNTTYKSYIKMSHLHIAESK